jgi:hypothetical protein
MQVLLQFVQLIQHLEDVVLQPDSFIWRWSPSSSASAYNALFLG